MQEMLQVQSLEEEMAPHSTILAWRIPRTEKPGGLQSMGSQRVGHDQGTEHRHLKQMLQRSWIRGGDQCTTPLVSGVFSHMVDQAQSPSWKGPACLHSEHHLEVLKLNPLAWILPLCHLKELFLQNHSKS